MNFRKKIPLISLFLTFTFLYTPIVVLVIFSFNTKGFPSPWQQFTLQWYRELFQSAQLWRSFGTSLIIATCSTFLSLAMTILLIYYQASGGRIKRFIPLFYGNLIIPETVLGVSLLSYFSLLEIPLGFVTLIIAHTILGLGLITPILYTRYRQLDPKLVEASMVLGATKRQTFFKITLPMLKPAIFAIGLLIFIISFDDFILSYFCAGTVVQPLSLYLLSLIRWGISPVVNALSAVLLLISMIFALLFFLAQRKRGFFR